ncbi:low temperature requirement protein A [Micromonospora sp. I033]
MERGRAAGGAGRTAGLLRGAGSQQQATLVELFFDLVVVFALNRVVAFSTPGIGSDSLAERWTTAVEGSLLILPLIWVWTGTAYLTARFEPRRGAVQVIVVATAFGMLLLGAAVPEAFDGTGMAFAVVYVVLQVGGSLVRAVAIRGNPLCYAYLRATCWFCLSAVPWLLGAVMHGFAQILLWSLAVAIDYGASRLGWPVPRLGRQRVLAWADCTEHLADRYRQLLLIALGEAILSVGIAYTDESGFHSLTKTLGLVIAFLTTVLLWRIYFHTSGELFGEAIKSAKNPASLGRIAGGAHLAMIMGVVGTAVGHELVQTHPTTRTYPAWLAVMVGGPATYMAGRALLEWVVFARLALRRLLSIGALLLLAAPLAFAPPLATVAAVTAVLLGIAVADARRSVRHPDKAPAPPR